MTSRLLTHRELLLKTRQEKKYNKIWLVIGLVMLIANVILFYNAV